MRFHWVILTGIIGGIVESIPYWEFFDPKQALPERRILFLGQLAAMSVLPFAIGFVAARDFGGSIARRLLAGAVAGLVTILVTLGLLYIVPSWVQFRADRKWNVWLSVFGIMNLAFAVFGSAISAAFRIPQPVRRENST